MKYFIHHENKQSGPYSLNELKKISIKPDCKVWCEEFDSWKLAVDVPEILDIIKEKPKTPLPFIQDQSGNIMQRRILSTVVDFGVLYFILLLLMALNTYLGLLKNENYTEGVSWAFYANFALGALLNFNVYSLINENLDILSLIGSDDPIMWHLDIFIFIYLLYLSFFNSKGRKSLGNKIAGLSFYDKKQEPLTFINAFFKYLLSFSILSFSIILLDYLLYSMGIDFLNNIITIFIFSVLMILFLKKKKGKQNLIDYLLKIKSK